MSMDREELSTILKRLEQVEFTLRNEVTGVRDEMRAENVRHRENIKELFARLDRMAEQGHEVRLRALEEWRRDWWKPVVGVAGLVGGVMSWAIELFKGGGR